MAPTATAATETLPENLRAPLTEPGPAEAPKRRIPLGGESLGLSLDEGRRIVTKLRGYYQQSKRAREALECYTKPGALAGSLTGGLTAQTGQTENAIRSYEAEYLAAERPTPRYWPISDANGNARSANFRLPVLRAIIDGEKAQLTQATFSNKPQILVGAGKTRDDQLAERVQGWYAYAYDNLLEYPEKCAEMFTRMGWEGVGVLYLPYRQYQEETLTRPDQGNPAFPQEEAWEETFNGPCAEVVRRDRIHLYPPSAQWINGPQKAWAVFLTEELSRSDLVEGMQTGKFDIPDEVWRDFQAPEERDETAEEDEHAVKRRDALSYTVVWCWCGHDLEGNGIERQCLFGWLEETEDLVFQRRAPLGGWRPFAQFYSRDPAGTFEGVSTAQLVDGCCLAINQYTNQLADSVTLNHSIANTPILPEDAGIDTDDLFLGSPIISNMGEKARSLPYVPTAENQAAVEFFWVMVEMLTGVSRNNMGVPAPVEKTATEVATVQGNNSLLFDQRVKMLDTGHREAARVIALQMFLNGPPEIDFRRDLSGPELDRARLMAAAQHEQGQALYDAQTMQYQMAAEARMQMLAMGDTVTPMPVPPEPPEPFGVEETVWDTLTPADFKSGLEFTPNGSTAQANYQARLGELNIFLQWASTSPFVQMDARNRYAVDRITVTSFKHLGIDRPEDILGPEPPPGMSLMGPMGPNDPNATEGGEGEDAPTGKGKGKKPQDGPPGGSEGVPGLDGPQAPMEPMIQGGMM